MVKTELKKLVENAIKPISVSEILEKISANKTTIYRELYAFMKEGLVNEVEFGDGKKRYELASKKHHHHLICKTCGKVEDIEVDESFIKKSVKNKTNFLIENHNLEFFGKCLDCNNA